METDPFSDVLLVVDMWPWHKITSSSFCMWQVNIESEQKSEENPSWRCHSWDYLYFISCHFTLYSTLTWHLFHHSGQRFNLLIYYTSQTVAIHKFLNKSDRASVFKSILNVKLAKDFFKLISINLFVVLPVNDSGVSAHSGVQGLQKRSKSWGGSEGEGQRWDDGVIEVFLPGGTVKMKSGWD